MKNTDPVLVLIAITVLTLEAAVLLLRAALVPLVALLLALAQWGPATPAAAATPSPPPAIKARPTPPQQHPLSLVATELEALPAATLRQMAGIKSRRHTKAALAGMVVACS
jgi:hypothetical protein